MTEQAKHSGQDTQAAPDGAAVVLTAVRFVGVPVSDQDRALDFYTRVLGFEKRIDSTVENFGRWIVVGPPGSDVGIALVPAGPHLPAGVETGVRFGTPDVEAAHAAMTARGVDADPVLHWEGAPPMYAFRDQDGNGFEIVP
ncbi:Catechol 2,3-dioxygenase [Actinacidiphila yanglinensis]|uniref:Catechol 2,3-dioxygenase n=1 Tax=Actinacidiphila yanglinensis TaxID=310779 RepID=A0A1H5ZJ70_9ACTN|nr:VOC family protein [Actinacidiphila yanglinensis]SEG35456.1 Catechol 2,3-dioxygenase [Actinacidiphila yanglinensis]